ncbi:hypothetical protein V499_07025 [Pseudogymnoascus sp. VKM F-103]|nr:hypothetical protein V499_07025 [Pseudogymnoascus sp. VKM F-103]
MIDDTVGAEITGRERAVTAGFSSHLIAGSHHSVTSAYYLRRDDQYHTPVTIPNLGLTGESDATMTVER